MTWNNGPLPRRTCDTCNEEKPGGSFFFYGVESDTCGGCKLKTAPSTKVNRGDARSRMRRVFRKYGLKTKGGAS